MLHPVRAGCDWAATWPKRSNVNECQTTAILSLKLLSALGSKSNTYLSSNFKRSRFMFDLTSTQRCSMLLLLMPHEFFGVLKFASFTLRSKQWYGNTERAATAQTSLKWTRRNEHPFPSRDGALTATRSLGHFQFGAALMPLAIFKRMAYRLTEGSELKLLSCLQIKTERHRGISNTENHNIQVWAKGLTYSDEI